jgi:hypothetical protein
MYFGVAAEMNEQNERQLTSASENENFIAFLP